MTLDQFVAKRIQTLRKEFQLTQEQLAEAAGLDVSSIAKIERGERSNIKVNTLEKIVEAFGLSLSSFLQDYKNNTNSIDPLFEKFHNRLLLVPQEKQKEYLRLFEEIVNIENL
ncbi:TPA: helix-turn-helix transcriptional regulator [Streptococcus equi subsp. zooepidemicus]|uniref:helix-turn-helix domain-containing protein n=1 Tax=Streptococcus equi TaxID=1336 RepID=UPI000F713463|nr:helix-turn-helix transcriptional regulator [Streptococcus equi]VED85577.1 putative transcriptional regulator, XRE family protein [Streptococcus equi subsp. equi]MCD3400949.1 helix-turn-helix domain-containing protein [Streptococcus equi subsp. zooepidemicus]MCD3413492.1 helix-turn-helix domain-containing protein [Streptococcus equi subsp. zooepidemicus]MCD3430968.1 helix-turn-helix domain-containing protein [Streptococcus equi subsp. zooepidemicus]QGM23533.1 helix-turn-helix domain-containi